MDVYRVRNWFGQKTAARMMKECNQPKAQNTLERLIQ